MRMYVIGDVHGQLSMLTAVHDLIVEDRQRVGDLRAPVVHLGDLCDRGPDTAGVLQFLIDGIAAGAPWHVLKGNHDAAFAAYLADPERAPNWLSANMGGAHTLASYGVLAADHRPAKQVWTAAVAAVPRVHRSFLGSFVPVIETEHLVLVHAGIRPGVPLIDQDEHDLIWIRDTFLDDTRDHGKLVVHGHTPVQAPLHLGNRVALDTGAGFGRPLTAAVFEDAECFLLTPAGRVALKPQTRTSS